MKRKKRKKIPERVLPPEFWEQHDRVRQMLADRIAYHEARIAARERGEGPDPASA